MKKRTEDKLCRIIASVMVCTMVLTMAPGASLSALAENDGSDNAATAATATTTDASAAMSSDEAAALAVPEAAITTSDDATEPDSTPVADESATTSQATDATATEAVTSAPATAEPVTVTLALTDASIVYEGQTLSTSENITAITGQSFSFEAVADEGYEITNVKFVADGTETQLSATDGVYNVDGALIAEGARIVVETTASAPVADDSADSASQTADDSAVLTPQATNTHEVIFTSCNNTVMTQNIADGSCAVAPDDPAATGASGQPSAESKFQGWSIDGHTIVDVSTYTITADTEFIAVFATPTSHTVTINYMYEDTSNPGHASTSMAYQPYQAVVNDGADYSATVTSPTITGFHLYDATQATITLDYTNITTNESVTVIYTGDPSYYTVKYVFEQLDGTYTPDTSLAPDQHLTGAAGAQTNATATPVTGYTVEPIAQATIATAAVETDPDQTVVTVKYDRTTYTITYDTDGGSYVAPAAYKYGAAVTAPENPTKLGYTFQGWDTDGDGTADALPATMPANNVTAKAVWQENAEATYTVVYWQQSINDDKSTVLDSTGVQSGVKNGQTYNYVRSTTHAAAAVGSTVTADATDQVAATGFVYNPAQSVGVVVKSDGSSILNVYFDRQYITFNFYTDSARTTRCTPTGDTISATMTYSYGNMPTGAQMTGLFGQTLDKYGYSWPTITTTDTSSGAAVAGSSLFIDWQEGSYTTFLTSFISRNNSYTTHDFYVPGSLTYPNTIMHWKQNIDGSYSVAPTNQTGAQSNTNWNFSNKYNGFTVSYYKMSLSTDPVALPVNEDYTGWLTCNPTSTASIEATDATGATVRSGVTLRIIYTRNKYTVSYLNPDSTSTGLADSSVFYEGSLLTAKPATQTGTTSAQNGLTRPAGVDADYTFEGWYLDPECTTAVDWTSTMAANNLAVYAKWVKPNYTVKFDSNGGSAETAQTVAKYSTITVPTPTRDGYTFVGWYYDDNTFANAFVDSTQITSNITLHAKWQKTGTVNYTAYYKDDQGNYFSDTTGNTTTDQSQAYTTTGAAAIGTAATVSPIEIQGYYPASGSKSIVISINDTDNTVVFTYKPAVTWTYTINCYIQGTNTLIQTKNVKTYSAQVVVWPEGISGYRLVSTYKGYTLNSGSGHIVAQSDSSTSSSTPTIDFFYTQDPTFHVTYAWGTDVPGSVTLPTDSKTYQRGQMVTVDTTYTSDTAFAGQREGVNGTWEFSGWGENFAISGDMTVHGSWVFIPDTPPAGLYTATYEVSGDIPSGYTVPVDSHTYSVGATVAVAPVPDAASYPGYTFSGWTLGGTTVTSATITDSNLVFKGVWTKDSTVTPTGGDTTSATSNGTDSSLLPKTGDPFSWLPLVLLLVAAGGITGMVIRKRRDSRE